MIIWSSQAKWQLQDIYDYIFIDSPQNAEIVIVKLVSLGESLSNMPYKNPKESTLDVENIRFIPIWNYKIIYRIEANNIIILSIFNTLQGFMKIRK
jgi:plasmid stabilization system protein ParE